MKKGFNYLCIIFTLIAVFFLGWRVMPRVWPSIKESVVYPVIPQLRPSAKPATTPEPYRPKSDSIYGEPVSANDSLIYYFYKDYCPYCRELEPLTAGLPKRVVLPDGTISDVKLICLNKVEDDYFKIITDYYQTNDIPDDRQLVPAIVIGNRYLFLRDEIVDQLMEALVAGEGLTTPMLDSAQRLPE